MVVPATVAAVRPASTNHTLGLIEVVVVIIFGSVGGADEVSRMTSGRPAMEAVTVLIISIKPMANRLSRPPPPISGGRGGASLDGGSGSS